MKIIELLLNENDIESLNSIKNNTWYQKGTRKRFVVEVNLFRVYFKTKSDIKNGITQSINPKIFLNWLREAYEVKEINNQED